MTLGPGAVCPVNLKLVDFQLGVPRLLATLTRLISGRRRRPPLRTTWAQQAPGMAGRGADSHYAGVPHVRNRISETSTKPESDSVLRKASAASVTSTEWITITFGSSLSYSD